MYTFCVCVCVHAPEEVQYVSTGNISLVAVIRKTEGVHSMVANIKQSGCFHPFPIVKFYQTYC